MLMNNIKKTASAFQKEQIIDIEDKKEESEIAKSNIEIEEKDIFTNDFLKIIMKKTIPMMELGYKINGEDKANNILFSIFSLTTKINLKDPKTLLSAQIPMLESYEPDDVDITLEDQIAIYDDLAQKPMNDEEIITNNNATEANTKLNNDDPLVLIYHTHTTESYTSSSKTKIDYISPWRTLDESKNMTRIGKEVKSILENQYGIKVIHDKTVHDYPDYSVSYTRSLQTIEKVLKDNPTIKYVFDLHRDGLTNTKKNRDNYVTVFGEQELAKVMMVVGNDNFNSDQNMSFAQKIQNKLDDKYPGITKDLLNRDNRKYNQFVSDYAALIEVGSNLNTLEEAVEASKPIANVLGEIITELEE
jgi:stage II sporulation protein P